MTGLRPRPRPCPSCPYRLDVPSGIWAPEEYEKLRIYDAGTGEQAMAGAFRLFTCHQANGMLCAGWVGCHDMTECLAVRLHYSKIDADAVYGYVCPVPLFGSGAEAAAHGMADAGHKSAAANAALDKIVRVRALRGDPVKYRED